MINGVVTYRKVEGLRIRGRIRVQIEGQSMKKGQYRLVEVVSKEPMVE